MFITLKIPEPFIQPLKSILQKNPLLESLLLKFSCREPHDEVLLLKILPWKVLLYIIENQTMTSPIVIVPTVTCPTVTCPTVTCPIVTGPTVTDLTVTDLTVTDLTVTDLTVTDLTV